MNQVDHNEGGAYDPATGAVTAPTAGAYLFCLAFLHGGAADDYVNLRLFVNGTYANGGGNDHLIYDTNDYDPWKYMHGCLSVSLNAGDVVQIQAYGCEGIYEGADNNHERFYGHRL